MKDARVGGRFGVAAVLPFGRTTTRHFVAGHQPRQVVRKGPQLVKPQRRSGIAGDPQSGEHVVAKFVHHLVLAFRVNFEHFGSRVFFVPRKNDPGEIDLKIVLNNILGKQPPEFVDYYVGSLPFGSRAVEDIAFVGAWVFLFRGFGVAREFDLGAVAGVEQNSILEPPFAGFYNPNFRRLAFDLSSS